MGLVRNIGCVAAVVSVICAAWGLVRGAARAERPEAANANLAAASMRLAEPDARDAELVHFAGGAIRLEFDPSQFALSRSDIVQWVRESARATTVYFGRFPVPYVRLVIDPAPGTEVVMGRAVGRPEPRIVVTLGRHTKGASLAHESLLVHEMVHLAVPDHDLRHLWLHEGIATYVEYIARAQAGLDPARAVWADLIREIPMGLPSSNDWSGLDGTPSDGRRYWGGALFCLLADVEIRKATGNRLGLQDALRALQRQGGNLSRSWSLERTIEVADQGTGTLALHHLYKLMGNRPHVPDLSRLWRELGLKRGSSGLELDDGAPLAAIRRAITDQPSGPLLVAAPRLVRVVGQLGASRMPLRETGASNSAPEPRGKP